ncbi:hypothetical protein QN277_008814 [Acacia crassicarpa]|nr:hypothetical protein QN277_008814 [Acacia crassicarpa]
MKLYLAYGSVAGCFWLPRRVLSLTPLKLLWLS